MAFLAFNALRQLLAGCFTKNHYFARAIQVSKIILSNFCPTLKPPFYWVSGSLEHWPLKEKSTLNPGSRFSTINEPWTPVRVQVYAGWPPTTAMFTLVTRVPHLNINVYSGDPHWPLKVKSTLEPGSPQLMSCALEGPKNCDFFKYDGI